MTASVSFRPDGPFDLPLSLTAAASFLPPLPLIPRSLRLAVRVSGRPAIIEICQRSGVPPVIAASATIPIPRRQLSELARWLTACDLDLRAFYRIVAGHPIMGPIAKRLRGLKPLRPPSMFEMALIAITERQLSLAAAFYIRTRLVQRFGTPIEDLWIFPTPEVLAEASLRDLVACGLSHRKAEYVKQFAQRVAAGELALETLKDAAEAHIRDRLLTCRGFGPWSIQYILLRGLGKFDCLPSDDVGLRRTIGRRLSHSHRLLSPGQLERTLAPFTPFRGLAAFYLAVDWHLQQRLTEQSPKGPPIAQSGQ
jgi:3-methyladenine DNA glycosylase/8-oxoguanine DNA glycosylase